MTSKDGGNATVEINRNHYMSQRNLKTILKAEFDLGLDISGGWSRERSDPIVVHLRSEVEALKACDVKTFYYCNDAGGWRDGWQGWPSRRL